jgi:antitoxin ParD1/3/4
MSKGKLCAVGFLGALQGAASLLDKDWQTASRFDIRRYLMATMNVSLPDAMKAWVEGRAETGRYSNASDYVRDLIRRDQVRADKIEAMQRLMDEAEESGISPLAMSDILKEARKRAGVGHNGI